MSNLENTSSEITNERKEMKGPSFSFDPKIFLNKNVNEKESVSYKNYETEKNQEVKREKVEQEEDKELDARQKLRQKLLMKKMMRQNKGNLKRMYDSKIKS